MITKKYINNYKKYPLDDFKEKKEYDSIYHGDIFPFESIRCFIIGPSGSGKTYALRSFINYILNRHSNLFFISPTIHNDKKQENIIQNHRKLLIDKDSDSYVKEFDDNLSQDIIKNINDMLGAGIDKEKKTPKVELKFKNGRYTIINKVEKERKSKIFFAKNIVIIDDADPKILSSMPLYTLIKKIRHYDGSCFILSQGFNDLSKRLRNQMNVFILMPNISPEKLRNIYDEIIWKYDYPIFEHIYKTCVNSKDHTYLTILRDSNELRCGILETITVSYKS